MAERLLMLALSPTMDKGIISKWNKNEGDQVASGDVLCEVETDKATMDYESPSAGVLLKIVLPEGAIASIGDLIAIVGKEGEDVAGLLSQGQSPAPASSSTVESQTPAAAPSQESQESASPSTVESQTPAATPSDEKQETASSPGYKKSSPLARKLATMNGLDLNQISGSGPAGRVVQADIEKALTSAADLPHKSDSQQPLPGQTVQMAQKMQDAPAPQPLQDIVIPVSGKRKIIAQRLSESMFSAPHYYLKVSVEMDALIASRNRLNATPDIKVSMNAYLIKLAAEALKKHPIINSSWTGDTIIQHGRVDVGLAVAQKDGLITPIVRDCGNKGILQIDHELKDLVQKARSNSLTPDEYTGATFTISSLGSYGIEEFTAIINPPGSAILAVGEIRRAAVVQKDDSIQAKSVMKLTLSCDHRVIDGSVGAEFLADLRQMLEEPVRALY